VTYAHCYSPDEIRAVATRVRALVDRGRLIRLTPATGWLVDRALIAHAAKPSRERLMGVICGSKNCARNSDCMNCMGKASYIMRLFEAEEIDPVSAILSASSRPGG
jgi:hypothetical protein